MDARFSRQTTTNVVLSLVPPAPPKGGHPQDRPMRDAFRTLTRGTRLGALAAWRKLFRATDPARPAGRLPERIDYLLSEGVPVETVADTMAGATRQLVYDRARALGLLPHDTPPSPFVRAQRRADAVRRLQETTPQRNAA